MYMVRTRWPYKFRLLLIAIASATVLIWARLGLICSHVGSSAFTVGAHGRVPELISGEELKQRLYAAGNLWKTNMHVMIRCGQGKPRFRLAYMAMRNRLEITRLVLEEAQCPYELEVIGFEDWPHFKQHMPHGRVPVLYDFDGKGNDLAQETAVTQFLAKQLGLAGQTEAEEAMANMLYQQFWSTFRNNGVTHDGDLYSAPKLIGITERKGPKYQEMQRVNTFTVAERSLAALGVFEERLEETGTGFLVGSSPTYIDLALFNELFELAEDENVPDFATRFNLPRLGTFLASFENRPQIRAYLESPGRIPRYSRPEGAPGSQERMVSGYKYCEGKYSPRVKDVHVTE